MADRPDPVKIAFFGLPGDYFQGCIAAGLLISNPGFRKAGLQFKCIRQQSETFKPVFPGIGHAGNDNFIHLHFFSQSS